MFLAPSSVDVEKGSWLGTTAVTAMVNNAYIMLIYLKIDNEGSTGKCKAKSSSYNLFVIMQCKELSQWEPKSEVMQQQVCVTMK